MRGKVSTMIQAFVLSYIMALVALAVHEVAHLVILFVMGKTGVLLVAPWRLGLSNYYIYGLHAQPTMELTFAEHAFLNLLGPVIAMIPFTLLYYYSRDLLVPRTALIANLFILVFFALLEFSYVLLEEFSKGDVGILGSPEFNIGIPIIIILGTSYWKIRREK